MKYKPRLSNFDDLQDEATEQMIESYHSIEKAKDCVAELIDSYVEAIIKEHLDERYFGVMPNGDDELMVYFSLGDWPLANGFVDSFNKETLLEPVLLGQLGFFDDGQEARKCADMLERVAAKYRIEADEMDQMMQEIERG